MTETVNIHETDGRSITEALPEPSRRDRSRFGLGGLRDLRKKYGPKSAVGHRCSNIEELLNQPKPQVALVQWQVADLKRLLAL